MPARPRRPATQRPKARAGAARKAPARPGRQKAAKPARKKAAKPARKAVRIPRPPTGKTLERLFVRVEDALAASPPPGVLSWDEFLWVVSCIREFAMKLKGVPSEDDVRDVFTGALDDELRAGAAMRLLELANDADADERVLRKDLLLAWLADPVRVTAAVFGEDTPSLYYRDDEEGSLLPSDPEKASPEAWRAWAEHLDKLGDKAAAARVRRTGERMQKRRRAR